ncbi:ABC transporter permease [Sinorhizobium alkalisoli]|uniref:Branched-chain amino acid ABC transporter permease n=1 Tax=Sinorhizobium alkalisoli TaxID=1752398 RepID=A0A1E3V9T5_9HYPH|nr:ABC transporter permease [Sinorhizobium alkalisoli]MCA1489342.1 ABC transporter permease [Ensifer sp. NBAIM29]MCG5477605.1 ABC transporter permease [Sinorhizobium alkalisoli]ODR90290.1 branched-chain amino acid ABC transporter permease [Sinorhizobium alkalisoli]QFI65089.1 L-rhamnose ABC transporter, transmembrane component 2 [Sinorhizobium alkalisoli]
MMAKLLKHREALLVMAIAVLLALIALRFPAFVAPANLARVFNDTSILIILALGQMAVILTRCIDLSMAANLALCGMVAAMLNTAFPGLPIPLVIVTAMALGALLGMINGTLVWKLAIPPIVVTLGTLTIYRGLIFLLTNGKWINAHEMSVAFKALPRLDIAGVPMLSWLSIAMIALMFVVMSRTSLGRAFYAVGGNPHAAIYTGIDVGRTRFFAYSLSGALAGLSGYLWVSRYAVAYVDIAAGFELDIIAACVIGGISIAGGIGSVAGAVLGALFLGVIKNALPVINISPFAQMAISGTVIIIAVAVNARAERRKGRVILRKAEAV